MDKSTDDLDTYRGSGRVEIPAPSGRRRAEPLIQTPGPYGWSATPENVAAAQANARAIEAQRARHRAARKAAQ